jgi:hypothetical protein
LEDFQASLAQAGYNKVALGAHSLAVHAGDYVDQAWHTESAELFLRWLQVCTYPAAVL